jgi:hypothetical protein
VRGTVSQRSLSEDSPLECQAPQYPHSSEPPLARCYTCTMTMQEFLTRVFTTAARTLEVGLRNIGFPDE